MKQLLAVLLITQMWASQAWSQVLREAAGEQQLLDEIVSMLREHPQLIPDLHANLQLFIANEQGREAALETHRSWLFEEDVHPRFGPRNSERTLVVFTDYNCPYCKRLEPVLQRLHKQYPELGIVNVYVPLRQGGAPGTDTGSAQYALGVWRDQREDFADVHDLLLKKNGLHSGQSLNQIATRTGTDSLLQKDAAAEAVIARNLEAFHALGLRGTPSLLIGDEIVPGYLPYEQLQPIVEQKLGD
ncbi:DsbA family protein [Parahaliea mediterranea]|uniref:DsbA family protein n=1 Tax=Parahaliea mediterranea TaxID=651086 RepID=A0A939IMK6_9GAMM|nr:DsbA family protein [Parahaliea mediterranea]MBN7797625.1 DsbA family protein [Parahaliea mediterranea]